jgi:hypothetical protein
LHDNWKREHAQRAHRRPKNPLTDALAHVKQPLSRQRRGRTKIEFRPGGGRTGLRGHCCARSTRIRFSSRGC